MWRRLTLLIGMTIAATMFMGAAATAAGAASKVGSADATWGGTGRIGSSSEGVPMPDGSVILYRSAILDNTLLQGVVTRRLADGRADAAYGNRGAFRTTEVSVSSQRAISAVKPHPAGGVVVVGPAGIFRLDAAGTLVASFGVGGRVDAPPFWGEYPSGQAVGVDRNGNVVVPVFGGLRRYAADGAFVDTAFDNPYGVAVASDGAYATRTGYVGTYRLRYRGTQNWSVPVTDRWVRYAISGDSVYVADGTTMRRYARTDGRRLSSTQLSTSAVSLTVDRQGRVLITDATYGPTRVTRFQPNLARDLTFGDRGTATFSVQYAALSEIGGTDRAGRIVVNVRRFSGGYTIVRLLG